MTPRQLTPRLAFVQDALPFYGGAERVLAQALATFPGTPVYTFVHNPACLAGTPLARADVRPSWINLLPAARRHHRLLLPFFPLAAESLDLRSYDLVVSFSYAAAHGVRTSRDQAHVALYYTPLRQAYHQPQFTPGKGLPHGLAQAFLGIFRRWDAAAGRRPDYVLAVSHWVAELVRHTYQRSARVLYPPVEIERFSPASQREDYYLCVARLEPHKRLDIVVRAFNQLGLPLYIVGEGRCRRSLEQDARGNIRFVGSLPDSRVAALLSRARAFVHAAEEDFGIALVEAQAAGCPVIAYRGGGAAEIVTHGSTGLLYDRQDPTSLAASVMEFAPRSSDFSPAALRTSAERFSAARFRANFTAHLQAAWNEKFVIGTGYEPVPLLAESLRLGRE